MYRKLSNKKTKNIIMKNLIITSILFLSITVAYAQCNPNAGPDDVVCGLTVQVNGVIGTPGNTVVWTYVTPAPGNVVIVNPNGPITNITVDTPGDYYFVMTETDGVCSASDTVMITFLDVPTATFNITPAICEFDTAIAIYTGNAGPSAIYSWNIPIGYVINGYGQGPVEAIGLYPGIITCSLMVTENGCSSTHDTTIVIFPIGSPNCCTLPIANAGQNDSICGLTYDLQAVPSWGLGTWGQTVPAPSIFSDIHDPNSTVTVPVAGTYIFTWIEENGISCSDTDYVTINFLDVPNIDAGADFEVCGHWAHLNATSQGNGAWFSHPGGISDTNDVSGLNPINYYNPNAWVYYSTLNDSYTFVWQEWNSFCVVQDSVTVYFWDDYPAVELVDDSTWCGLAYPDLNAQAPPYGDGFWIDDIPNTEFYSAGIINSHVTNPDTALVANYGMHYFHWVVHNGLCKDTTAAVAINFIEIPNAEAGLYLDSTCGYSHVLNAIPSVGIGMWSLPIQSAILGYFHSTMDFYSYSAIDTITVIDLTYDENPNYYEFYWSEDNGNGCTDKDTIRVIFKPEFYINGNVNYILSTLTAGDAEVELYNVNSGNYNLVYTSAISGTNEYNLFGNEIGDYILKARVLNHTAYPDALDSYYDYEILWENAHVLTLNCGDSLNIDIDLARTFPFTPGNGNVSGIITYQNSGDPVTDAVFFVEDTTVMQPYLYTPADINGYYEFDGLPLGAYQIIVDIPGIPQITTHNFTVTALDTLFEHYDYYVDTVLFRETGIGIYADATNIQNVENPVAISMVSVYPNPFHKMINLGFELEKTSLVEIQIIDVNGKVIKLESMQRMNSGEYTESIEINEKGIYFIILSIDNKTYIKKIISE